MSSVRNRTKHDENRVKYDGLILKAKGRQENKFFMRLYLSEVPESSGEVNMWKER